MSRLVWFGFVLIIAFVASLLYWRSAHAPSPTLEEASPTIVPDDIYGNIGKVEPSTGPLNEN
jgi:hypothetical protein